VLLLSWTFIFQICLQTKLPPGSVTQNYTMFLFCGMLPWLLFQDTVLRSASSMLEQATLITRTLFPAEVVPISIFLSSLIHHLIALLLVMIASVIVLKSISPMVLLLPLYMLFIGLFAVWAGSSPARRSICGTIAQASLWDNAVFCSTHHDQRAADPPFPAPSV
jgi:ABC-type polysaccharide/polyol phosphate export permease